jgi:hypothetical protein
MIKQTDLFIKEQVCLFFDAFSIWNDLKKIWCFIIFSNLFQNTPLQKYKKIKRDRNNGAKQLLFIVSKYKHYQEVTISHLHLGQVKLFLKFFWPKFCMQICQFHPPWNNHTKVVGTVNIINGLCNFCQALSTSLLPALRKQCSFRRKKIHFHANI